MDGNNRGRSSLEALTNSPDFQRTYVRDRAPTRDDWKNFKISDLWIHRNLSESPGYEYFILVDKPNKTGIWIALGETENGNDKTLNGGSGRPDSPNHHSNLSLLIGHVSRKLNFCIGNL